MNSKRRLGQLWTNSASSLGRLVAWRGPWQDAQRERGPIHAARLVVLVMGLSLCAGGAADAAEVAKVRPLPKFDAVRAVVLRELIDPPARIPGDMIARSEAKPVFDQLRLMGWVVAEEKAILKRIPSDTDFVLQRLRTPKGKRFMRKVTRYPQGYDRLYRLVALRKGRQTLVRLIESKGGDQLIGYLTESRGGSNMGKMLQQAPRGARFNQPTGKIFTADALVKRLKKSYTAEQERRAKGPVAAAN